MATIQLTKPESKMYRTLISMQLPFRLFAQYKQPVKNKSNFYLMDFAVPELGIDIECDGQKWHSSPEDKQKDKERDYNLASMGWRVVRFTEEAINEHIDKVATVIQREIASAAKRKNQ
jgi:very-short-patch-repair endonuclease